MFLQYFDTVGWIFLTCKNRLPYNLYCVGVDVKHCSIQSNLLIPESRLDDCCLQCGHQSQDPVREVCLWMTVGQQFGIYSYYELTTTTAINQSKHFYIAPYVPSESEAMLLL